MENKMRDEQGRFIKGHQGIKNSGNFKKGHIPFNKGKPHLQGEEHPMFGKKHTEEARKKMSEKLKGRKVWNEGMTLRKGKYLSPTRKSHPNWCSQSENFYRVPKGFVIHHLDLNPRNNNPENLIILDNLTHNKLHNQISKIIKWGQI